MRKSLIVVIMIISIIAPHINGKAVTVETNDKGVEYIYSEKMAPSAHISYTSLCADDWQGLYFVEYATEATSKIEDEDEPRYIELYSVYYVNRATGVVDLISRSDYQSLGIISDREREIYDSQYVAQIFCDNNILYGFDNAHGYIKKFENGMWSEVTQLNVTEIAEANEFVEEIVLFKSVTQLTKSGNNVYFLMNAPYEGTLPFRYSLFCCDLSTGQIESISDRRVYKVCKKGERELLLTSGKSVFSYDILKRKFMTISNDIFGTDTDEYESIEYIEWDEGSGLIYFSSLIDGKTYAYSEISKEVFCVSSPSLLKDYDEGGLLQCLLGGEVMAIADSNQDCIQIVELVKTGEE